jgi:serine/threonine-protein kinase RIO1
MCAGHKLINRCGILQANVYYATTAKGDALAVKVYKTSILVFKYISATCFLFSL